MVKSGLLLLAATILFSASCTKKVDLSERVLNVTVTAKVKDTDAIEVFFGAIENIKPQVMVKSRRVGGANYQVPVEVGPDRQVSLAMRWMITFAQKKKGKPMDQALASEIIDAFNKTGSAVKKKDEVHRMAAANKAFAHYRW